VKAFRGGTSIGPNPTDRDTPRTKDHLVVSTDGLSLAALPSAANVHDAPLFPDLLRLTMVVCASMARLYADAGCYSAVNRWLCPRKGIYPVIRKTGQPHGSALDKSAVSLSTSMPGCLSTNAWIPAMTGWAPSSMRGSPQPASSSSCPASLSSENRALAEDPDQEQRAPGFAVRPGRP
jgi:hypothetical protein